MKGIINTLCERKQKNHEKVTKKLTVTVETKRKIKAKDFILHDRALAQAYFRIPTAKRSAFVK